MSFHARDNFKAGPISQVPASWFNGVANFLNNLCGGLGVRVMRDATPPQIALDVEGAKKALAIPSVCPNAVCQDDGTGDTTSEVAARAPAAVEQVCMDENGDADDETDAEKIARIGTSKLAARADHKHRDPKLHNTRQILSNTSTGNNVKMFEVVEDSGNFTSTLKFYPPKFDCGGRFIGLSSTAVELCKFYTVV